MKTCPGTIGDKTWSDWGCYIIIRQRLSEKEKLVSTEKVIAESV